MNKRFNFEDSWCKERLHQLRASGYPAPANEITDIKSLPIGTPCYVITKTAVDLRMFAGIMSKTNSRTGKVEEIVNFVAPTGFVRSKLVNIGKTYSVYTTSLTDGIQTSAGFAKTQNYDDGCAKGIQVLLGNEIVCALDVYEPVEGELEGEARVLVYKAEYAEDEEEAPIACVSVNR